MYVCMYVCTYVCMYVCDVPQHQDYPFREVCKFFQDPDRLSRDYTSDLTFLRWSTSLMAQWFNWKLSLCKTSLMILAEFQVLVRRPFLLYFILGSKTKAIHNGTPFITTPLTSQNSVVVLTGWSYYRNRSTFCFKWRKFRAYQLFTSKQGFSSI